MYGGNNKTLAEIASEVKRTVIGQDEVVDWLCGFADVACTRSRVIHEEGADPLALPNIGSALLIGPTASGKSHLLKTFAKCSGLLYHPIDAGQMSAEGYIGNSFSKQWAQVSAALAANPRRNVLVFIDEVDKMFGNVHREGSAKFDLLKPLEGGVLNGQTDDRHGGEPFELDCDRCIFVLAGAFTGIEDLVRRRLGISTSGVVGFSSQRLATNKDILDANFRKQATLDDVEHWGVPREIIGRISTIMFLAPLGEEALRKIVRNNKQAQYSKLLTGGATLSIDKAAEDLLVERALKEHYGARYINQQLNELLCVEIWHALSEADTAKSVVLTAHNGAFDYRLEDIPEDASNHGAAVPRNNDYTSARASYGLLRDVHAYISRQRGEVPFDPHAMIGDDCTAFAAALLCQSGGVRTAGETLYIPNDYTLAEITLLHALVALLRDWFPENDYTPSTLKTLLSLADPSCPAQVKNPLDLIYYQIESGKRYLRNPEYDPSDPRSKAWVWMDSLYARNTDGLKPADVGGLKATEDTALGLYAEFKDYPRESQKQAVYSLAFRLL